MLQRVDSSSPDMGTSGAQKVGVWQETWIYKWGHQQELVEVIQLVNPIVNRIKLQLSIIYKYINMSFILGKSMQAPWILQPEAFSVTWLLLLLLCRWTCKEWCGDCCWKIPEPTEISYLLYIVFDIWDIVFLANWNKIWDMIYYDIFKCISSSPTRFGSKWFANMGRFPTTKSPNSHPLWCPISYFIISPNLWVVGAQILVQILV